MTMFSDQEITDLAAEIDAQLLALRSPDAATYTKSVDPEQPSLQEISEIVREVRKSRRAEKEI